MDEKYIIGHNDLVSFGFIKNEDSSWVLTLNNAKITYFPNLNKAVTSAGLTVINPTHTILMKLSRSKK